MSRNSRDDLIDEYLTRLRRASRQLPREQRRELIAQIEEHLADAIPADATLARVRETIDQLGAPEALVTEQLAELGLGGRHAGSREWVTIVLLVFGGFLAIIGWLVGAWMLWWSPAWTTTEKVIGTLIVPGGLLLAAFLSQTMIEPAGKNPPAPLALATIIAVILPLATCAFLAQHARSKTPTDR